MLVWKQSNFINTGKKERDFMKMTGFWYVAPCTLIEIDRRFGYSYCLRHKRFLPDKEMITLIMEVVSPSETSVNMYQATYSSIPPP
jgi:hypothetical protein